ncbi:hypothetical protein [Halocatena halophila]|uniref:hypothetical protein n=1 Tax=Halocatena halophila TaxID=2814576 RepID=UPI002ECFE8FE
MVSPIVRALRESIPDTVSIICGLLCLGPFLLLIDVMGVDIIQSLTAGDGMGLLWLAVWGVCSSVIGHLRESLGTTLERRDESMESVR